MELTKENYFGEDAQKAFFSASQVKAFNRCEAGALADIAGDYTKSATSAVMIGSYVDAYFEGTLDAFKDAHPEIFNSRTGALKADYLKAEDMIRRAESDSLFMKYMDGAKQVIMTGEIEGVPFRAKLDVYKEHERIVDLKTVKDMEPLYKEGYGRMHPVEYWQWDIQMAIYQELVYQTTGEKLPCYLAIITKEDPSGLHLLQIDQERLDVELELLKEKIVRLDAIKRGLIAPVRCEKCAYCRQTKVLTEPELFGFDHE